MADVLYAARGSVSAASNLYTVDPVTGTPTSIGSTGHSMTGLAVDPITATMYGVTSASSSSHPNALITIDPVTGAGTFIATLMRSGFFITVPDIAFDSAGVLYGFDNLNKKVCTINKATAAVTDLGATGVGSPSGNALAIDGSDVVWWLPQGTATAIYTVNVSTGAATSAVAPLNNSALAGPGLQVQAASFDGSNVLWAIYNSAALAKLNVSTGVWTSVGALGGAATWDALAWALDAGGSGGTGAQPEGVSIAFNDPALEAAPTWTRVDA